MILKDVIVERIFIPPQTSEWEQKQNIEKKIPEYPLH